jgi:hypothetical protein
MEKSVMNAAGIVINDDGTPIDGVDEFGDDDESDDKSDIKVVSVENLERMLEEATYEDYDIAIAVR